jgi:hypothetical protein
MHRFILAFLSFIAAPAFAQQKDCSAVPEAYRAMCEEKLGGAMAKKQSVDQACAGKKGDDLKNCVAHSQKSDVHAASGGAAAREACRKYYDVKDQTAFRTCMREEMAKHPGNR